MQRVIGSAALGICLVACGSSKPESSTAIIKGSVRALPDGTSASGGSGAQNGSSSQTTASNDTASPGASTTPSSGATSGGSTGGATGGVTGTSTGGTQGGANYKFIDDFSDTALATSWTDDDVSRHDFLRTGANELVIHASPVDGNGWYRELSGPYLYQTVPGDFMVQVTVRIDRIGREPGTHFGEFTAAGLMLRSTDSAPYQQRWLVFNFGYQSNSLSSDPNQRWATELKWTRDPVSVAQGSLSSLYLNTKGDTREITLRVCKIGNEIRSYSQLAPGDSWNEEVSTDAGASGSYDFGDTLASGEPTLPFAHDTPLRFTPPIWTAQTQVGVMANAGYAHHEGRATYKQFSINAITEFGECEAQ